MDYRLQETAIFLYFAHLQRRVDCSLVGHPASHRLSETLYPQRIVAHPLIVFISCSEASARYTRCSSSRLVSSHFPRVAQTVCAALQIACQAHQSKHVPRSPLPVTTVSASNTPGQTREPQSHANPGSRGRFGPRHQHYWPRHLLSRRLLGPDETQSIIAWEMLIPEQIQR